MGLPETDDPDGLTKWVLGGFALAAVAAVIGHFVGTLVADDSFDVAAEWSKAFFTLASLVLSAAVIGVVVKSWQDGRDRDRRERSERAELVASTQNDIRQIHADLKGAATRIKAHRSVATYGVEGRRLMEIVAAISDVQFLIKNDEAFALVRTELAEQLNIVRSYVAEIVDEFEAQFLAASRYQSWFEHWLQVKKQKEAVGDAPTVPAIVEYPWLYLTGSKSWTPDRPHEDDGGARRFPKLTTFIASGTTGDDASDAERPSATASASVYQTNVSKPLKALTSELAGLRL